MSEQSYFDNIDFPIPEDPKRKKKQVYYLIEFNYEKSGRLYKICAIYIEENQLEKFLEVYLDCYYRLFNSLINFQIIERREGED